MGISIPGNGGAVNRDKYSPQRHRQHRDAQRKEIYLVLALEAPKLKKISLPFV
jgi:hypothetical protein